jgi:hypothetical protein
MPLKWYDFFTIEPKNVFVFAIAEAAFLGILVLLVSKIMHLFQEGENEEEGAEKKGRESKKKADRWWKKERDRREREERKKEERENPAQWGATHRYLCTPLSDSLVVCGSAMHLETWGRGI